MLILGSAIPRDGTGTSPGGKEGRRKSHKNIMPHRPIYLWEITVNKSFTQPLAGLAVPVARRGGCAVSGDCGLERLAAMAWVALAVIVTRRVRCGSAVACTCVVCAPCALCVGTR